MPHLDYSTFPGQIFWLIISFAALYFIVSKIIFPRVDAVLANRDTYIAGNLNKAEALRKSAEEAEKKLAALLHEAADESRSALAESMAAAAKKAEARNAQLSTTLEKKIAQSEKEISSIQAESETVLKNVTAEISDMMVRKILEAA